MTPDRYARAIEDKKVGPQPVTVYDDTGRVLRVISSASLSQRPINHQRAPEVSRRTVKIPSVPLVRSKTRAGRP